MPDPGTVNSARNAIRAQRPHTVTEERAIGNADAGTDYTGIAGPAGPRGATGATGATGVTGPTGAAGD